jgi:LysM repeat protein
MRRTFRYPPLLVFQVFALTCLVTAVACNYPGAAWQSGDISGDALRQTLVAQQGLTTPAHGIDATVTPEAAEGVESTPPGSPVPEYTYLSRSGDTLAALSSRFSVPAEQILPAQTLPPESYLPVGTRLFIPNNLAGTTPATLLMPDNAFVYSPTTVGFDILEYVQQAGGYLSTYREFVDGEEISGAEIVQRVASESSVSPRLLLALLEYQAGWVRGQPKESSNIQYPLGFAVPGRAGLYQEMVMAATHLNIGYYGWRQGTSLELRFADGSTGRISPQVNPGTAGVQNIFAKFYKPEPWQTVLYGEGNFPELYRQMFGDPWIDEEPLLPDGLLQPQLELPFRPGDPWSLSGGPHLSWNTGSPRGALDFSPVTGEAICAVSRAWATAAAPGVIARAANNVVALDLDGDGFEGTGWVLVYVHLANNELIQAGRQVALDEALGHPSCERGQSTGKHVHLARKYNGEWLPAEGPIPYLLSGWLVRAGERNYQGDLVKGEQVVSANPSGARRSQIVR